MAECWRKAGLPDGVLEIANGGGEVGGRLAQHPDVDGVLFTGSYATGLALSGGTLGQAGKLLALEMGGNNAIVVWDDADLDLAVAESALSIAVGTGQRCTCAGRLFVHRSLLDRFQEKLAGVLRGLRIGPPLEAGVFMGPVISRQAFDRIVAARGDTVRAGGERVLAVEAPLAPPYIGAGLVRYPNTAQTHSAQREVFFGPEAALYPVYDLDAAIAAVNDS
jgi:succinylglutamic semialdehyde dehydrogenase